MAAVETLVCILFKDACQAVRRKGVTGRVCSGSAVEWDTEWHYRWSQVAAVLGSDDRFLQHAQMCSRSPTKRCSFVSC